MTDSPDDQDYDRYSDVLGDALAHAANESLILARLEEYFSPKPATLFETGEAQKQLQDRVDKLVDAFGGPPRLIIRGLEEPKPKYDTYLSAALQEAIAVFYRTRRSVCRAQTFMIGAHLLRSKPDLLKLPGDLKLQQLITSNTDGVFWEHVETCFIRLAGFWDRIGQVLDFVFFSIRLYERDGFVAVADCIRANVLRMQPELQTTNAWIAVWAYKKSEREDGLQWLLSRRNLLVHSLHLRAIPPTEEAEIFESAFNHLDKRLRENLAPSTPEKEMQRINSHLSLAASLFPDILSLCEFRAATLGKP